MTLDLRNDLQNALYAGFIDGSTAAKAEYLPKLLVNDPKTKLKVLTSILSELESCDEFFFSVAFVTTSGVATLINSLLELQDRGIKGTIIASQYQDFTEPMALQKLLNFSNIDLRIQVENNFHAKGYLFRHGENYSVIVGSSNLTSNALCVNSEWNLRVFSKNSGTLALNMLEEFQNQYRLATPVTLEWIAQYNMIYSQKYKAMLSADRYLQGQISRIHQPRPNTMQTQALKALDTLRSEGRKKALLISATGTGKTYLSAFDVKIVNPKRFLFVVHRENIARAARNTFKTVFGDSVPMGLFTGHEHDCKSQFIFSTVQTLSKPENLHVFAKDAFDYIVIDEVHRAGASSYQHILDYFTPNFLLGMSATPERTDGYDIFKAFDYNIAYEIRLHDALAQDMLSPFHYYGISDLRVDDKLLDEDASFNDLTSDERVRHILHWTKFYGCGRGRIKGLIFCSHVGEAYELSKKLNETGLKTIALTGESNEEQREAAIQLLESNDKEYYLDYVLTRDIFNEGIDIPSINQVVMLRPTQSAIVFVQQLGRGLRKSEGKEYLTVIDFIGNYSNNFMVPIALYGDSSGNKDTLRKLVSAGSSCIPGASTVNFDRITKEKIYESINQHNPNTLNELRNEYQLLKYKIGHIPTMIDFIEHGSRDPYAFIINKGSYYAFLCKVESTVFQPLLPHLMKQLEFFSKEICNGKRLEEVLIIQALLAKKSIGADYIINTIKEYDLMASEATVASAVRLINGEFMVSAAHESYECRILCEYKNGVIFATEEFSVLLQNGTIKSELEQIIAYSLYTFFARNKPENYINGFTLYEKYSRKDVCRILNWEKNDESTMYGYRIKFNSCPIFVTYQKSDDIEESTKYEDYFLNRHQFHWMTRNRVTLDSTEAQTIINYKSNGLRICLFVKQSDGESDDFYYIGDCEPYEWQQLTIKDKHGNDLPIVNFNYNLSHECDENLYNYLTSSSKK